jgi:hypothetical protein
MIVISSSVSLADAVTSKPTYSASVPFGLTNNLVSPAVMMFLSAPALDESGNVAGFADAAGGHFQVRDTGIGIEAQHIDRLTERFYRVDNGRSKSRGGTGLGLAIVKHVLMRHGAQLKIDSEPGRGSTFTCSFPSKILRQPLATREPVRA